MNLLSIYLSIFVIFNRRMLHNILSKHANFSFIKDKGDFSPLLFLIFLWTIIWE